MKETRPLNLAHEFVPMLRMARTPQTRSHKVIPRLSVQFQSNSRGWLHGMFPRKRHQMRYLCDSHCLVTKQPLSQLNYTPRFNHMILMDFYEVDYPLPLTGAFACSVSRRFGVTIVLPIGYGDFSKYSNLLWGPMRSI